MSELIQIKSIQSGVCSLRLNRPEKRNALCVALLDQLYEALSRLALDKQTRVVIVSGAGTIFSSGLDLTEAARADMVPKSAARVARALQQLRETSLITIAAVHGGAFAGGAGLMTACDIAIGTSDLKIAFPEAQRGLLPALICSIMSCKVREGDLRELFLVGQAIDAMRAQQIGLLQRVVPCDQLMSTAIEMAQSILAGGPNTIVATKELLNRAYVSSDSVTMHRMLELHMDARHSAEANEGLSAFLEKRSPNWI